jgi:phenylacetate-CoA ligase
MPRSFYKASNYLIDIVTGYPIQSELSKILTMDTWNREQILTDQQKKFEQLADIASTSHYYRSFKGKGLTQFPVMERTEFKMNMEKMKTQHRGPYSRQHSSGSTSNPVTLLVTKEMLLAKRVSHQKMLTWYGLERESPEMKIGGIKTGISTVIYYYLKNKRYFDSFNCKPETMVRMLDTYNRFKPAVLSGYPSALFSFAQYLESKSISVAYPGIIVTHAENLYREIVEKFNRIFAGAQIVNQYWSTEANIAVTCPHGSLHLDEDTVICEVINRDENGMGDLLVTNLFSYSQPIIRYKIGDRVKLSDTGCPCGRKTLIIENIEGRDADRIELPDKRIIPVTAVYLSRFAGNVLTYQLIYYKKDNTIEFCYKPVNENEDIDEAGITSYFKKDYGLSVFFTRTSIIQLTTGGKFKKLIIKD